MKRKPLMIIGFVSIFFMIFSLSVNAKKADNVRIEFDGDSKKVDLITDRELPDYKSAKRGSFQFFSGRLDEPEDFIRYFHDGNQMVKIENLLSMEKFQKSHGMWRLRFAKGRRASPQYIPRVRTLVVSFIPVNPKTGETERRVYLLLNDLELIDWGSENL